MLSGKSLRPAPGDLVSDRSHPRSQLCRADLRQWNNRHSQPAVVLNAVQTRPNHRPELACRSIRHPEGGTPMTRAYNVSMPTATFLSRSTFGTCYIDPKFRDRAPRIVKSDEKARSASSSRSTGRRRPAQHRPDWRGRRPPGRGRADTLDLQGRQAGRLRSAPADPRHGCRRYRRAFLYPSLGLFSGAIQIRSSPPRRAAPTTVGSPITASPIPTAFSAWRCCRCKMSIWRSTRCVSPERSSAFGAAFFGRTRMTRR